MRIDSIECFLTLAETLNYTEAADRLYITQSALSRLILQMEEELGVTLFARSRRGVELTSAGKSFYEDANAMLSLYSEGIARAKTAQRGERGRIRLVCHRNATEPALLDIIQTFSAQYRDIALDIRSMPTSEMILALDNGSADCGITSGCPQREGIEKILIHPYLECAVMSRAHPLSARKTVSMAELRDEKFVTMTRSASARGYDNVIGLTREAGFTPRIEAEADSVSHLLTLLARGDMITILSSNYEYMGRDRFAFVPLEERHTSNLGFVYNVNNPNPCVKILADFVRENYEYHGDIQPVRRDR